MFWSEQDSKSERIIAQRPRRSRIRMAPTYLQRKCRGNFEHRMGGVASYGSKERENASFAEKGH